MAPFEGILSTLTFLGGGLQVWAPPAPRPKKKSISRGGGCHWATEQGRRYGASCHSALPIAAAQSYLSRVSFSSWRLQRTTTSYHATVAAEESEYFGLPFSAAQLTAAQLQNQAMMSRVPAMGISAQSVQNARERTDLRLSTFPKRNHLPKRLLAMST